ncbi:MAG: isocitrate/isopropylmalate family dehydrogenase [Anaerolineales bacterium]
MNTPTIVALEGDQTGQELLEQSLRLLAPDVTRVPVNVVRFDLSLENRRATENGVVHEAAEAMRASGLGLKAATITPEGEGDVGSPNAILREEIDAKVILRIGRRIPGIRPVGGVHSPIAIVRMAVDDAYGAKEWREQRDGDEIAFRTQKIRRSTCHAVAEFSFQQATRTGAKVFGGPKYTVSPVYEGMFKEELDAAAARHGDVPYDPQLIDATLALLLATSGESLVIPTLNRDGDLLSDLVLKMFGTIAASESLVLGFDAESDRVGVVMAEAPHGTAPGLEGRDVANPMAMILAGAGLLTYIGTAAADRASRAIYEAAFEAVFDGVKTADLGGHSRTSEFTDEVIRRVKAKVEVWDSLS